MSGILFTGVCFVLTGIWEINSGYELRKTKNIEKYGFDHPNRIKDKNEYIDLFFKVYFYQGVWSIALGIFSILDEYYFNLSMKTLIIVFFISFALIFIESIVINKKRQKLI